ncbi:MAG: GntR family transcriptional regulator [Moraxellaceae bacterium]|nr:MAG: GntR family transcriptional regulator [Moraxellaceae bacterium]
MMKRYEQVAQTLIQEIEGGLYQNGERLPGVRKLARHFQMSVSTIVEALKLVEDQGIIEVAERSGHFVSLKCRDDENSSSLDTVNLPTMSRVNLKPCPVTQSEWVMNLVRATLEPDVVQLGAAVPHADYLAVKGINKALKAVCNQYKDHSDHYDFAPGYEPLRSQIALRMEALQCQVQSADVVITNGCQNALILALKAVTDPGDVVAIESPTFYGLLHVIESLGLKAIEIPADPVSGISIPALSLAFEQWNVRACVLIPNYGNPLGHCMSNDAKRALVMLAKENNVQLIEDDIYGDLGLGNQRALPLLAFDREVIYCSSFSKTLSPGLRVGWIISARQQETIEHLQYVNSLSASTLAQRVVYEYLRYQSYDRYLRETRNKYRQQLRQVRALIQTSFPNGTKVSDPAGGFVLWIECPPTVDTTVLYEMALEKNISIAPGPMFSPRKKYRRCFRINCAQPWNAKFQWAIVTLGGLVSRQLE